MRSTDQTFYDMKRLHVVFALSSALLVATTAWMFVVDHNRSWKKYQATFRDRVEPWLAETGQFRRSPASQPSDAAKRMARAPFVDAFGRSLSVEQIWLPELTIDYHFRRVARFDRCMTCHQGIDRAESGTPTSPAVRLPERLTVELATPETPPEESDLTTEALHGLTLAPTGILADATPTVSVVEIGSAATWAGLYAGDAIVAVNGQPVSDRASCLERLTQFREWGDPLELEIERGLPSPYHGHPRLDLFVGSKSPHPAVDFGCTICHAGQGSATDFKFASHTPDSIEDRAHWRTEHDWFRNEHWDRPMLPGRFTESSCLQCHHDVVDLESTDRYPDPPAPRLLAGYRMVQELGCFGCHEISGFDASGKPIGPDLRLESLSGDHSGTMRKVGPSLRHLAGRFEDAVLDRWIAEPRSLRQSTRMPRLFGLHEHLEGKELARVERHEAVEIQAVRAYLAAVSQPLELLPVSAEVTETPSARRGEDLFVRRGCAACHRHEDVPGVESTVGPDLTGLGSMVTTEAGRNWLVSWIRDPVRHSSRTPMPNALLAPEPIDGDADGDTDNGRRRMSDSAADLAAFLLRDQEPPTETSPEILPSDVDALIRTHLTKQFPTGRIERFLAEGIPAEMAEGDLGDVVELVAPISLEKKLRYLGRRTIRKRGCFGCHDIPGFENAQPIGPALTDWGRKQESLLAFEQVPRFLEENPPQEADGSASDRRFFTEAVTAGRREGFLWQKLRRPRSFDYEKTEHKGYNSQLLMGYFTLTPNERESIMTFVLGLVADPPSQRYLPSPDRRAKAIIEGRKVLDRHGCAECHTLEMARWRFRYDPEWWQGPLPPETFDFAKPHVAPQAAAESLARERTGWGRAEVTGRPMVDPHGETILDEDDDGNPLYVFSLWEPAVINGDSWQVGGAQVPVAEPHILGQRPPRGGAFARLLYPCIAEEAGAAWLEAWGQVPPALVHEGSRVQPDWLYDYLLNPVRIRPAVPMRMPKYDLSPAEAAALVDYFAAVADVPFPYTAAPEPPVADPSHASRMDQALRLVTDRTTFCAKCHLIGDFDPGGETRTILAPNLAEVGRRIRPEYLRRWLAAPKSILPYTGMPENFPPTGPPLGQDLLPGSSREQLDAVADLLLHWDAHLRKRTSIRAMVDQAANSADDAAPED